MTSKHYFWTPDGPPPALGAHSAVKHDVYADYVGIYIDRLTRRPAQSVLHLTVVDGFCGGGLYEGGVQGSPLRLLAAVERAAAELAAARLKGFDLRARFVFADAKRDHVEYLRGALIARGHADRLGRDIELRCGSFEAECPAILDGVRRHGTAERALFFLDQYGWSAVSLKTVRTILDGLRNAEVILTFAVDALIDFLSEKSTAWDALLGLDLQREDVRQLLKHKNQPEWRFVIQNGLYGHVRDRTGATYYTPFFVRSPDAHRSYWLLHLSKHRQARDEMGRLHWGKTNRFIHTGKPGFRALGFSPDQDLRQEVIDFGFDDTARGRSEAALLDEIPRALVAAGRPLALGELYASRCNDSPVTFELLTAAIVTLREEGEVEIVGPDGHDRPRARNLTWDDSVRLVRQPRLFGRRSA